MARAALIHLLRSQSTTFRSGYRLARVVPWSHTLCSRTDANSTIQFSTIHRRFLSQPATVEDKGKISIKPQKGAEEENEEKGTKFLYEGPISTLLRRVKVLSLSTCFFSTLLGPIVTFMTYSGTNVILKGALASSVVLFSVSTTAALHWFASPYVHKLTWQPGSDSFEVETLSWLATYRPRTIKFADIKPPQTNRPYVLFEANGNYYFVDEENCPNKALMAKLTPWNQDHATAPKNS